MKIILRLVSSVGRAIDFNQWVTGSSPVRVIFCGFMELADAPDLGSGALRRGGSSP